PLAGVERAAVGCGSREQPCVVRQVAALANLANVNLHRVTACSEDGLPHLMNRVPAYNDGDAGEEEFSIVRVHPADRIHIALVECLCKRLVRVRDGLLRAGHVGPPVSCSTSEYRTRSRPPWRRADCSLPF